MEKRNKFLVIDIGSEAVKVLAFEKIIETEKNSFFGRKVIKEKTVILASALYYFDKYSSFEITDFEIGIIKKAINASLADIKYQFSSLGRKDKLTDYSLILMLSPDIFRARIFFGNFPSFQKNKVIISQKEENKFYEKVKAKARRSVFSEFRENYGILPSEVEEISSKIIRLEVDGYPVEKLAGLNGQKISLKILLTFAIKDYLKVIKKIFSELGFNDFQIIHLSELWPFFLKEKGTNIFLDIGGEISQVFLEKSGALKAVGEFDHGGKMFSLAIKEKFGLSDERARVLKEEYALGRLSKDSANKIRECLFKEKVNWLRLFQKKMEMILSRKFLPASVFLLGGASLLPEIKDSLLNQENFLFDKEIIFQPTKVELMKLEKTVNIINGAEIIKNPQYGPALLSLIKYYNQ